MTASLAIAALLLAGQPPGASPANAPSRPSIVFILADDLGWGDLSSYGNPETRTPRIDEIGKLGIRFSAFYSAAPVCSAARAALLTGREPERTGVLGVLHPNSPYGLPDSEITLAELLRQQGYVTAAIGKWHLGRPLPTQQGFDHYYGLPYSNNMGPFEFLRGDRVVERVDAKGKRALSSSLTGRYTDEAVAFLASTPKDRPFFLYLAHAMPHSPFAPSKAFARRKGGKGVYADTVEELDASVGRLLDYLRTSGRLENTIVVFTSDNGADGSGSNGSLRGGKFDYFEGGIRVPCLVAWPGRIRGGRVEDTPASMLDWLPTLVGLAGGRPAADATLDGRDIAGLLLRGEPRESEFFFRRALRSGNEKLVLPEAGGSALLFDLGQDPGESQDLAPERPERVAVLTKRLEEHQAQIRPPKRTRAALDDKVEPMLDGAVVLSGDHGPRLEVAVELLLAGRVAKLLLTGAGRGGDSAAWLRDRAIDLGAREEDLLLETSSRSTFENLANAAPILRAQGWRRAALVTSPVHMQRALLMARSVLPEVEWTGVGTEEVATPRAELSEAIKRLWYRLSGRL